MTKQPRHRPRRVFPNAKRVIVECALETCQLADGIARVEEDGTVIYTDKSVQIFKEILDFDLTPLVFDECDERADELVAHFRALL